MGEDGVVGGVDLVLPGAVAGFPLVVPRLVFLVPCRGVQIERRGPAGALAHDGGGVAASRYGLGLERCGRPAVGNLVESVEVLLHGHLADHQAVLVGALAAAVGHASGRGSQLELTVGVALGAVDRVGHPHRLAVVEVHREHRSAAEALAPVDVAGVDVPAAVAAAHGQGVDGGVQEPAVHRHGQQSGGPEHGGAVDCDAHVDVVGHQVGIGGQGGAVVVEGEDLLVGVAGLGPSQGAVLAHSGAVPPAAPDEGVLVVGRSVGVG